MHVCICAMLALIYGCAGSGLTYTAASFVKDYPVLVFASAYTQQAGAHIWRHAATYYEYSPNALYLILKDQKKHKRFLQIVFDEGIGEDDAIRLLARKCRSYNIRVVCTQHTDKVFSLELKQLADVEIFTSDRAFRDYFRRKMNKVSRFQPAIADVEVTRHRPVAFKRIGGRFRVLHIEPPDTACDLNM